MIELKNIKNGLRILVIFAIILATFSNVVFASSCCPNMARMNGNYSNSSEINNQITSNVVKYQQQDASFLSAILEYLKFFFKR